jgi:dUTP pyrophosphatase
MYNEMINIKWLALPNCPQGQLSKNGDSTDAGYDLMTAEDIYIPTMCELEESGSYSWECIETSKDLDQKIRKRLERSIEREEGHFSMDEDGLFYRKKYIFPLISTGVCIKPDTLMWSAICSRSGTATKYNVSLINSLGVIDFAYCGPNDQLKITSYAIHTPMVFRRGERIAQLIPMPQLRTQLIRVEDATEFEGPNRGGFNSTGL